MTPTPKQRAELAARECAANIDLMQQCEGVRQAHEIEVMIQSNIPIQQLFAVEDALIGMSELCDNYFDESGLVCERDRFLWKQHIDALLALNNWRKERNRERKK